MRAFGELEYVLGRLFRTLLVLRFGEAVAEREADEAKKLQRLLGATLGRYGDALRDEAANLLNDETCRSLDRLVSHIKPIASIRNAVCHGVWGKAADGSMTATFWSDKSLKTLREGTESAPEILTVTRQEILVCSERVRATVREVITLRQTIEIEAEKSH